MVSMASLTNMNTEGQRSCSLLQEMTAALGWKQPWIGPPECVRLREPLASASSLQNARALM